MYRRDYRIFYTRTQVRSHTDSTLSLLKTNMVDYQFEVKFISFAVA